MGESTREEPCLDPFGRQKKRVPPVGRGFPRPSPPPQRLLLPARPRESFLVRGQSEDALALAVPRGKEARRRWSRAPGRCYDASLPVDGVGYGPRSRPCGGAAPAPATRLEASKPQMLTLGPPRGGLTRRRPARRGPTVSRTHPRGRLDGDRGRPKNRRTPSGTA